MIWTYSSKERQGKFPGSPPWANSVSNVRADLTLKEKASCWCSKQNNTAGHRVFPSMFAGLFHVLSEIHLQTWSLEGSILFFNGSPTPTKNVDHIDSLCKGFIVFHIVSHLKQSHWILNPLINLDLSVLKERRNTSTHLDTSTRYREHISAHWMRHSWSRCSSSTRWIQWCQFFAVETCWNFNI